MGVKAPDVKFVLAPQGPLLAPKAQAPRGVWGHALQEIFKIEHTETPFPAFLRQGWNSLKFSLKSKILNENGSKSKTPKYWYQSTGRGMRNDRTISKASGLKRKLCCNFARGPKRYQPLFRASRDTVRRN